MGNCLSSNAESVTRSKKRSRNGGTEKKRRHRHHHRHGEAEGSSRIATKAKKKDVEDAFTDFTTISEARGRGNTVVPYADHDGQTTCKDEDPQGKILLDRLDHPISTSTTIITREEVKASSPLPGARRAVVATTSYSSESVSRSTEFAVDDIAGNTAKDSSPLSDDDDDDDDEEADEVTFKTFSAKNVTSRSCITVNPLQEMAECTTTDEATTLVGRTVVQTHQHDIAAPPKMPVITKTASKQQIEDETTNDLQASTGPPSLASTAVVGGQQEQQLSGMIAEEGRVSRLLSTHSVIPGQYIDMDDYLDAAGSSSSSMNFSYDSMVHEDEDWGRIANQKLENVVL